MAFIDFQEIHTIPMPVHGRAGTIARADVATVDAGDRFDQLERQVLAIAKRDGKWSLGSRGRPLDRLLRRLFGTTRPNTLADPRLEALRRFAVTVRVGGVAAIRRETAAFLASGFTPGQRDALLGLEWAR